MFLPIRVLPCLYRAAYKQECLYTCIIKLLHTTMVDSANLNDNKGGAQVFQRGKIVAVGNSLVQLTHPIRL